VKNYLWLSCFSTVCCYRTCATLANLSCPSVWEPRV